MIGVRTVKGPPGSRSGDHPATCPPGHALPFSRPQRGRQPGTGRAAPVLGAEGLIPERRLVGGRGVAHLALGRAELLTPRCCQPARERRVGSQRPLGNTGTIGSQWRFVRFNIGI